MIGGKFMSERKFREYTHVKLLETEILKMKESGKTHREIAEHLGFRDKYVVKEFIKRHNRVQKQIQVKKKKTTKSICRHK